MARYLPVVMLLVSAHSFCAPIGSGEESSDVYTGQIWEIVPGHGFIPPYVPPVQITTTSRLAAATAAHAATIGTDLMARAAGLDSEVTALATATSATSTPPASGRSSRGCASPERTEF